VKEGRARRKAAPALAELRRLRASIFDRPAGLDSVTRMLS